MFGILPGPDDDQSVYFLWQIFGNIIYWISGTNPGNNDATIIHFVISAFNSSLLSLVLVIYAIILFIGTINTAHQGEFLGRNWSSMWMPIRAIFGPLCVVPIKYGYCLAQIILLYGVLVGVQLANFVWTSVVQSLDNSAIPAVPVSLISDVKYNVGKAVLYRSVLKVANDFGLETVNLPSTSIKDNSYECDSTVSNRFYDIGFRPTFCVNSQSDIPTALTPKLTSYASALCNAGNYSTFAENMRWLYDAPYNYDHKTVQYPGLPQISTSSLSNQCINAVNKLLSDSSGSRVKTYAYNFGLDNEDTTDASKLKQTIMFNAGFGDSVFSQEDDDLDSNIRITVTGNISFDFNNQDYATGQDAALSNDANHNTNVIVNSLTANDIPGANNALNAYLTGLNRTLLDFLGTSNSSSPQNIAINSDGSNYYQSCQNYLATDETGQQTLSMRYLQCLQLKESGQVYSLSEGADPNFPYENYINSWWIGGESYLNMDKIMNNNIKYVKDRLDAALAYPGMDIISTMHYNIPITISYYPLVDGEQPIYNDGGKEIKSSEVTATSNQITAGITSVTKSIPQGIDMVSGNWPNYIYQAVPSCTVNTDMDICDDIDKLQNALIELPSELQPSFIYLFSLLSGAGKTIPEKQEDLDLLNNVLEFLQQNGIYQTNSTTTVPVYAVIDKVFNKIGGNGSSADVTGMMTELYNLGLPSSNMFSKIMQAQQVGADIVEGVVDSFTSIFENYKKQFRNIEDSAKSMIEKWAYAAFATAAVDGLFKTGGSFSGVATSMGTATIQLYMATQIGNLSLSMAWLPIAFFVLGSLFTAAISFVVMMPLIPYFLFWAGTIVWVLSILEGLIAAPLVAMALVYPEGHEVMGHGSPAIKIALNVIFRPVLMVIGIITAMTLSYVIITYSAQGFHLVGQLLLDNFTSSEMTRGIISTFLIFIYASFIMIAFTKCFSVIYLIPDKVFEWIGAPSHNRAGEAEVQQLQGKTDSASGQAGSAMGSGVSEGSKAESSKTRDVVGAKQQDIQVAEKTGSAAGSTTRDVGETAAKI